MLGVLALFLATDDEELREIFISRVISRGKTHLITASNGLVRSAQAQPSMKASGADWSMHTRGVPRLVKLHK